MNLFKKIFTKLKKEKQDMFYSYYLFGLAESQPMWAWEEWKKYLSLIQPIIELSPELPSIKTSQSIPVTYGKNNQYASYNKGGLRFGKMLWNEQNNEKWTTKYVNEKNWTFFDTEIAFPTRSHCHNNGGNPDLLISIHNENLTETENRKINQAIVIHIKTNLIDKKKLPEIEKYILLIAQLMNCKVAGEITRPSAFESNFGAYTDAIFHGSYGVVDKDTLEFSENFIRYGIKKII